MMKKVDGREGGGEKIVLIIFSFFFKSINLH